MLFRGAGTSKLQRVQGAFITEEEIARITEHWAKQGEPEFEAELLESPEEVVEEGGEGDFDPDSDDLLDEAIRLVVQTETASVSMIQRRLRVGYTRAGRLIDMLERRGVISGYEGSKPRQVLITQADLARVLAPQPRQRRSGAGRGRDRSGRIVEILHHAERSGVATMWAWRTVSAHAPRGPDPAQDRPCRGRGGDEDPGALPAGDRERGMGPRCQARPTPAASFAPTPIISASTASAWQRNSGVEPRRRRPGERLARPEPVRGAALAAARRRAVDLAAPSGRDRLRCADRCAVVVGLSSGGGCLRALDAPARPSTTATRAAEPARRRRSEAAAGERPLAQLTATAEVWVCLLDAKGDAADRRPDPRRGVLRGPLPVR